MTADEVRIREVVVSIELINTALSENYFNCYNKEE